jgi:hypothetical protein
MSFLDLNFSNDYYTLIETSFENFLKYLIVFSILFKQKSKINILKHTFKNNTYGNSEFIDFFNCVFVDFDFKKSAEYIKKLKTHFNDDYFLQQYYENFSAKAMEYIIENYLLLNTQVDLKLFASINNSQIEETKKMFENFFNVYFPDAIYALNGDVINFTIPTDKEANVNNI